MALFTSLLCVRMLACTSSIHGPAMYVREEWKHMQHVSKRVSVSTRQKIPVRAGRKVGEANDKELLVAVGIACKDGSAPRGWRPINAAGNNVTSLHATFRPLDSGEKRLIGRSNIWKRVVLSYTMLKSRCAHNGRVHDIGFEKNCLTFLYTSLVILYFHLNF